MVLKILNVKLASLVTNHTFMYVDHQPSNLFHNLLASCFTLTYPLYPIVLYIHTHTHTHHNTIQVCSMSMTKVNDDMINES